MIKNTSFIQSELVEIAFVGSLICWNRPASICYLQNNGDGGSITKTESLRQPARDYSDRSDCLALRLGRRGVAVAAFVGRKRCRKCNRCSASWALRPPDSRASGAIRVSQNRDRGSCRKPRCSRTTDNQTPERLSPCRLRVAG